MKNRWKTDEKPMKSRWKTDEKPMKNWWETDEKPMRNLWKSDEKPVQNSCHKFPLLPKLPKVAKSRQKSPKVAKSWPTVGKCCQSSPWRTPGQNVPSKPGQYVSRDIKSPQDHVCQGGHIVPGQYMSWDIMSRDKMSPDRVIKLSKNMPVSPSAHWGPAMLYMKFWLPSCVVAVFCWVWKTLLHQSSVRW